MPERVLLVEDDHGLRGLLRLLFEDHEYDVRDAEDGPTALGLFREGGIDVVVLDVRLPGISGFDVCREIRRSSTVPIIMLSARNDTHDIVAGLELGADDYVTKPFDDHELLARVRVQLRAVRRDRPHRVVVGDLEIREPEGTVTKGGVPLQLTRTEFVLLCELANHQGQVLSRAQLLESVWEYPADGDTRVVDTHVARLRSKIETVAGDPKLLVTVRGLGYKLAR
jgi:DNA-binding response OmpR family regulator